MDRLWLAPGFRLQTSDFVVVEVSRLGRISKGADVIGNETCSLKPEVLGVVLSQRLGAHSFSCSGI